MRTSVDPAQLRALVSVVDEGSFELAAAALHLTPSAVSQRIKALETSTGRILVRRTKPTEVTDAGRPYLRLARQIEALVRDVLIDDDATGPVVPLAVNSDSMATWVLPALASVGGAARFHLHREDEGHSADLLRSGAVMAAITTDTDPVQGCSVTRLGTMRYRAMASRQFAERWFPAGASAAELSAAPVVVFDRKDELQDRYLRLRSRARLAPPRHYVPGSSDFAAAVRLGLGWGMLPDQQSRQDGNELLVRIDDRRHVDVVLYWQQWKLHTPALDAVASAVRSAAADHLT
jgi:LysR family transcriptional regulator (chromosome initiation inhibitor)